MVFNGLYIHFQPVFCYTFFYALMKYEKKNIKKNFMLFMVKSQSLRKNDQECHTYTTSQFPKNFFSVICVSQYLNSISPISRF